MDVRGVEKTMQITWKPLETGDGWQEETAELGDFSDALPDGITEMLLAVAKDPQGQISWDIQAYRTWCGVNNPVGSLGGLECEGTAATIAEAKAAAEACFARVLTLTVADFLAARPAGATR